MRDVADFFALGSASVVAPAGHGKTELIAKVAAKCRRALILTHTHAGVHAIRERLKRLGVPHGKAAVDTIAGWSMRYAHSFPGIAKPPEGTPQGPQWDQLYLGATHSLSIRAVREVVEASYDFILIDEYQDCGALQHKLALSLSSIVPTLIFGDPMQGIFEFAGATLDWSDDIFPHFPLADTLETPHRWVGKNPALGEWIAETRGKLERGDPIDLTDPRISYRKSTDAFDMATFFEGIENKEGTFAAIHCNKTICYNLARATNGGYQAIEELAARRLREFAESWDHDTSALSRRSAISRLMKDCFRERQVAEGETVDPEDTAIDAALVDIAPSLAGGTGPDGAVRFLSLSRKHPRWKLFRSELWRDSEQAAKALAAGRAESMSAAVTAVCQRVSMVGRNLPKRTVSTPLLLKGLEFDHVVIPNASHFASEQRAQAKLFYVAISRAKRSLVISSPESMIGFPRP